MAPLKHAKYEIYSRLARKFGQWFVKSD
jgi:hypothetical protein